MSGQNPLAAANNQPPSPLFQAMAHAQHNAAERANMCDNFLNPYRQYVGPVHDVHELQAAGQSPDLLSMRFAILKAVRDEEASRAQDLAHQMIALHANENQNRP